jgi:excisionase family DNA binding protein
MTPAYLDYKKASEYTSLGRTTLKEAKAKRLIPHYKIGKKVEFAVADLDAFMARFRVATPQDEAALTDGRRRGNR